MSEAALADTHPHGAAHAAVHHDPAESPLTPESWGKLGMWIFLAADAMTFEPRSPPTRCCGWTT